MLIVSTSVSSVYLSKYNKYRTAERALIKSELWKYHSREEGQKVRGYFNSRPAFVYTFPA